jgi:hypothetical protein
VTTSDGKVSFETNQLGTFKVVSAETAGGTSSSGGGGGGGGGCFISAAGI